MRETHRHRTAMWVLLIKTLSRFLEYSYDAIPWIGERSVPSTLPQSARS